MVLYNACVIENRIHEDIPSFDVNSETDKI